MFWYSKFMFRNTSDDATALNDECDTCLPETTHAKRCSDATSLVTHEREWGLFLLLVALQCVETVRTNPQDLCTRFSKLWICRAEPARLNVSARRERFGEKIQDQVKTI